MAARKAQELRKLQAQDSEGIIEMVLGMIDAFIAASGNAWLRFLWRFVRGALTGMLPEPEPNAMVQAATSLDSLIEFVLTVVDKYVAESGRPLLAFAWKVIRPHLEPAKIAQVQVAAPAA
jgi:hypothetical protein